MQAVLANIWYGFPSNKLKVIGVTGTDGKTTTTHLIYHILKSCGKKVSMISTVYAKVGEREYETGLHTTTPDSFLVQKMLALAVKNNDEYFVLEVTSHAIDQNRVWGIRYFISAITNITPEHLDYHSNFDEYAHTKIQLLRRSLQKVVNLDDAAYKTHVVSQLQHAKNIITYSLHKKADYKIDLRKQFPRLTKYNAANYAAAYAVASELKIEPEKIREALSSFQLPQGRMDIVYDKDYTVIVDFAHTPNALRQVLQALALQRKDSTSRIIHVFGSAGLRDRLKRPYMGRESGTFADIVILTEEDYRTEDPLDICETIASGLKQKGFSKVKKVAGDHTKQYCIVIDRSQAISQALAIAKKGDIVVLTGKGHEKSLCRGKKEYPWDDIQCVRSYFNTI